MEFALLGWPADEPTLRLDYRAFSYAGKFVTGGTGIAVMRANQPVEFDPEQSLPADLDPDTFVDEVVAAVAFNEDRTDQKTLWLRYVTVHTVHRGEGLGPRLVAEVIDCAGPGGSQPGAVHAVGPGTTQATDPTAANPAADEATPSPPRETAPSPPRETVPSPPREYERVRIAVNNPFAYEAMHKVGFGFTGRETGIAELVLERPVQAPVDVDRETYQSGLDRFRERKLSVPETEFLADHAERGPPESQF